MSSANAFGVRLKWLRERAGLSQQELGQHVFLTRSAISHFEAGRRNPDHEQLRLLATALGTTVAVLMGEAEPEPTAAELGQRLMDMLNEAKGLEGRHTAAAREEVPIPIVGRVPADTVRWTAALGGNYMGELPVPDEWTKRARFVYAVEVSGDCLRARDIRSGDHIVLGSPDGRLPFDNEVALVRIGDEVTLKVWSRVGERVELRDGDGRVVASLDMERDDAELLGFFIGHLRP